MRQSFTVSNCIDWCMSASQAFCCHTRSFPRRCSSYSCLPSQSSCKLQINHSLELEGAQISKELFVLFMFFYWSQNNPSSGRDYLVKLPTFPMTTPRKRGTSFQQLSPQNHLKRGGMCSQPCLIQGRVEVPHRPWELPTLRLELFFTQQKAVASTISKIECKATDELELFRITKRCHELKHQAFQKVDQYIAAFDSICQNFYPYSYDHQVRRNLPPERPVQYSGGKQVHRAIEGGACRACSAGENATCWLNGIKQHPQSRKWTCVALQMNRLEIREI